jgi:protein-tyrosine phosphatase
MSGPHLAIPAAHQSMKYAAVFAVLGLMLAAYAIGFGGWGLLLLGPAASFLVVALAYAAARPGLLGKRADGHLARWALALHLPFFALTWGFWHGHRWLSRKPACHEVVPGVWIGRRLLPAEVPPGVTLVVDLTAEFPERPSVRSGRAYLCLPTLDGMPSALDPAVAAAEQAATWPGGVLIHCGFGYERTGVFAAAVLLARGHAADPAAALELVRVARPGVRPNPAQLLRLQEIAARCLRTDKHNLV